jgi:hypothetical protein
VTSEDAKNWTTVAAILVGGWWALFEFDVLSLQRNAADAASEATLAPRVNTDLSAEVGFPPDILEQGLEDCTGSTGTYRAQLPTRMLLTVQSPMEVSVHLRVTDVVIRYFESTAVDDPFDDAIRVSPEMGGPVSYDVSGFDFGTLSNERTLEPGERNRLFFAAFVPIEVPCAVVDAVPGEQWFEAALGLRYTLTTQSSVLRGPQPSRQASMLICRIDLARGGGCFSEAEDGQAEEPAIGLARGLNATWTDGGLLYSPPFR